MSLVPELVIHSEGLCETPMSTFGTCTSETDVPFVGGSHHETRCKGIHGGCHYFILFLLVYLCRVCLRLETGPLKVVLREWFLEKGIKRF